MNTPRYTTQGDLGIEAPNEGEHAGVGMKSTAPGGMFVCESNLQPGVGFVIRAKSEEHAVAKMHWIIANEHNFSSIDEAFRAAEKHVEAAV